MDGIRNTPGLELQVIATGMHLSPEFGLTYRRIEDDGFNIDTKIEMLLSADTPASLAKSMGLGMIGFGEAWQRLKPDLLFLLGDRFEIFSAAASATVARIPIAHAHGGETTEGSFDEAMRHSITKMSHLHLVAAEQYRKRVIQLGEAPERVFVVGGLGVESIKRTKIARSRCSGSRPRFRIRQEKPFDHFSSCNPRKCELRRIRCRSCFVPWISSAIPT